MTVALITGANRGLGLATAHRLANEGFDVIIGSRDVAAGQLEDGAQQRHDPLATQLVVRGRAGSQEEPAGTRSSWDLSVEEPDPSVPQGVVDARLALVTASSVLPPSRLWIDRDHALAGKVAWELPSLRKSCAG